MENSSKWSSAPESSIHIMPPLQLIAFAQLPTKQNDAPISERGEIDQAALKILQLHAESFEFPDFFSEICEDNGIDSTAFHSTTSVFGSFGGQLGLTTVGGEPPARTLNPSQNLAH